MGAIGTTYAVDLDGTLAEWVPSNGNEPGAWMEGGITALRMLRERGDRIIVHSCRATWDDGGGIKAIATFLRSGGFVPYAVTTDEMQREAWHHLDADDGIGGEAGYPSDTNVSAIGIWCGRGKPIASRYIDDRALTFESWYETMVELVALEHETLSPSTMQDLLYGKG